MRLADFEVETQLRKILTRLRLEIKYDGWVVRPTWCGCSWFSGKLQAVDFTTIRNHLPSSLSSFPFTTLHPHPSLPHSHSSLTPPSLGFRYVFWFLAIKTIWLIGQAFLGRDSGDASIWFKNRVISRLRAGIIWHFFTGKICGIKPEWDSRWVTVVLSSAD